jgi:predicted ATPase/DNA-binding winged helix-turn-helix (wHTH) protein
LDEGADMDVSFGQHRVRPRERLLIGPTGPIKLSSRSFDLLWTLLQRPEDVVMKDDLLDAAWPDTTVDENALHVHMSALRKALGPGHISTVHGRGYRYTGPLPDAAAATLAASATERRGNAARFRVDCIARDQERTELGDLLARHRLVSILGAGGVGKTTVALAVANDIARNADIAAWVIDLAAVAESGAVENTIVQTLGIPFRPGSDALSSIVDELRGTEVLLVFDNCEHISAPVTHVVRELLGRSTGLTILTTTQVPLGLGDEHIFKLAPFEVPGSGNENYGAETASERFLIHCYEALGEILAPEERPIAAALCRRLDGVALGLKMAAARAATLGLAAVVDQIEQHLSSLVAKWDPSLPRHRSLTASLDWSYQLLSSADRFVFRRLGVFQGSFAIAAARAVAGFPSDDNIAELIQRSLVVRDSADRSRYRLLETSRHFALSKLEDEGEQDDARQRHANHMRDHFAAGLSGWETTPDAIWLSIYGPDGDNLRSAIDWASRQADAELLAALIASSYRYWIEAQRPDEGFRIAKAATACTKSISPTVAARLRLAQAEFARANRHDNVAAESLKTAVEYFERTGDHDNLRRALALQGTIMVIYGRHEEAGRVLGRLDDWIADLQPTKLKARVLVITGMNLWSIGHLAIGLTKAEAGLAMHANIGDNAGWFKSTMFLAETLHRGGDNERSLQLTTAIIPHIRKAGNRQALGDQLSNIAAYWLAAGDALSAEAPLLEASRLPHDMNSGHWCLLQNAADLASLKNHDESAVLLMGYLDGKFSAWPDGRQSTEEIQRERVCKRLMGRMDEIEYYRQLELGSTLGSYEADHLAGFGEVVAS